MSLKTDVKRYERGLELQTAQDGFISKLESMQVIFASLEVMKTQIANDSAFTDADLTEVDAALTEMKNKIRTDLLGEEEI